MIISFLLACDRYISTSFVHSPMLPTAVDGAKQGCPFQNGAITSLCWFCRSAQALSLFQITIIHGWSKHVNVCMWVFICWAGFMIKGLCPILNKNWFWCKQHTCFQVCTTWRGMFLENVTIVDFVNTLYERYYLHASWYLLQCWDRKSLCVTKLNRDGLWRQSYECRAGTEKSLCVT